MSWLKRNRFLAYGAPFLVLLVAGSFGLQHFAQLRYSFRKTKSLRAAEVEGLKLSKEEPTIENEFKKLKSQDLDTWSNIRGPRPWEDSKAMQDEQRRAE